MSDWSLEKILANLHNDIERRLAAARESFGHATTKGDASEHVWLELLQNYLPKRYQAERAHVVDSNGVFSHQIDVVIFDRQYSPFIFDFEGQKIVAAESVYAVFEAKQRSPRPVMSPRPGQDPERPAAPPHEPADSPCRRHISAEAASAHSWRPARHSRATGRPPLGELARDGTRSGLGERRLDIGCVAAHGMFSCDAAGCYTITAQTKGRDGVPAGADRAASGQRNRADD